jgi:hypothetical protein
MLFYDDARSFVGTEGFLQSRRGRKKIEMPLAHLKRILRLGRLRLRGPRGAQVEFVLVATVCVAGRSATTRSGSVHRVTLELRRGRQGRRIKAGRS